MLKKTEDCMKYAVFCFFSLYLQINNYQNPNF